MFGVFHFFTYIDSESKDSKSSIIWKLFSYQVIIFVYLLFIIFIELNLETGMNQFVSILIKLQKNVYQSKLIILFYQCKSMYFYLKMLKMLFWTILICTQFWFWTHQVGYLLMGIGRDMMKHLYYFKLFRILYSSVKEPHNKYYLKEYENFIYIIVF